MRFSEVENVWTVNVDLLSNSDRGRIYYERAKQVISEALNDPKIFAEAVEGKRVSRAYVIGKVGCTASVTTQNPKIKALLIDADRLVAAQSKDPASPSPMKANEHAAEIKKLKASAAALRRQVDKQEAEIAELRRKLAGS